MTDEAGKEYLSSLDRRVSGHDNEITIVKRDFSEVSQQLKQILDRINGGLSPSVNEVKRDNAEIRLLIKDLSHKIDLDMRDMKTMVRESTEHSQLMLANFEKQHVQPITEEFGNFKKMFIYGLVGALIVFIGQKGLGMLWDRVFLP